MAAGEDRPTGQDPQDRRPRTGALDSPAERVKDQPGAQNQDPARTPGDGTLKGATPAGLTVEELRRRAEQAGDSPADSGTG